MKRSHVGRVGWMDAGPREPSLAGSVERGLVSAVECPLDSFRRHAEGLVTRLPVTAVALTDVGPLSEPEFTGGPDDDAFRRPAPPRP